MNMANRFYAEFKYDIVSHSSVIISHSIPGYSVVQMIVAQRNRRRDHIHRASATPNNGLVMLSVVMCKFCTIDNPPDPRPIV